MASRFEHQGRLGRRRENSVLPRSGRYVVKVNAEEQAALLRLAAHQNVSVQRVLVESALRPDTSVSRADIQELITALFGLSRQISAVGVNLNQIAKVANATGEVPEDLMAALAGLRGLYFKTEHALDDVASVKGDFL
ncbi:plasmid mobilization relaxosome protein MobC [Enteractinococcus coprophilus]|uniref:plasmid mobilization relaxosome protein MobC n=1 Tax=Enteractinococcus coprophilus TaxID=1027633 RepID=UPI00114DF537|nr:plasmid mobilization relaxosome protein MobC [Enteractinococcus coprophilus]